MLELLLILSLVMNIMQFFWLVALAGERRQLNETIRWLQQQVEQLQRERAQELDSGSSSRLLMVIVLGGIAILVWLLISRNQ